MILCAGNETGLIWNDVKPTIFFIPSPAVGFSDITGVLTATANANSTIDINVMTDGVIIATGKLSGSSIVELQLSGEMVATGKLSGSFLSTAEIEALLEASGSLFTEVFNNVSTGGTLTGNADAAGLIEVQSIIKHRPPVIILLIESKVTIS